MLTWCCLVGCGAEIGGDGEDVPRDASPDAAPRPDAAAPADASPPGTETTVFAVPDVVDTYLRLSDPTFNYGGRDRMCADTTTDDRRILLRVDVSALPAGAAVLQAKLHIWTGTSDNDLSSQTYSLYQVLESWNEGNENGVAGAASWNERQGGTAWTVAGAGVGSRDDVAVGSFKPTALDTEYAVALQPDLVRGWIEDPASNDGIIIVAAGSDGACFATTENATAGKHPTLSVTWTPP